ncbi:MAG: hypothetical protein JSR82_21170 [Verrucomicrobia bacterium]|nr:hypothetical protein [Verrucomicrobiota bacterium]
MKPPARIALLLLLALAGLALRCASWGEVFRPWGVAFVDGDCYARMTRVEQVMAAPGRIVRAHDFENFPLGTRPHATAPLDYLIAAVAWALHPFCGAAARDLAGAWIGPLCFLLALAALLNLTRRAGWPAGWWAGLALFALSPISVHGTVLGRPDHQALLLVLLAAAGAAEHALAIDPRPRTALSTGVLWGMALWVSFYEPVLLFLLARAIASGQPKRFTALVLVGTGVVLTMALAAEGWRLEFGWLHGAESEWFLRWSQHIGELASQPPWSWTLLTWFGGFVVLIPGALVYSARQAARGSLSLSVCLAILLALTCWQARWAYFLVLGIALSVPLAAAWPIPRRSVVLGVALLPVLAAAWPSSGPHGRGAEADLLHALAAEIRTEAQNEPSRRDGILAPWWLCPPLAYWSGQPAIAGSSHQALAGALDAERVLSAANDAEAFAIIRRRRVRWIVSDSTDRLIAGAMYPENYGARSLDLRLRHHPELVPAFLELPDRAVGTVRDSTLSLVRVRPEYLPP